MDLSLLLPSVNVKVDSLKTVLVSFSWRFGKKPLMTKYPVLQHYVYSKNFMFKKDLGIVLKKSLIETPLPKYPCGISIFCMQRCCCLIMIGNQSVN